MKILETLRRKVDSALGNYLPAKGSFPKPIHDAMRYSVMAGGKRLRPILALLTGRMLGVPEPKIMPAACALELVHTYSLIHDDLPAMDNDDLRRGKPTCHKVYGEAIAILAGDALLTYAFQLVTQKIADKKLVPALVEELSVASGSAGMVGGQVLDITAPLLLKQKHSAPNALNLCGKTHLLKTATLITAACRMGAVVAHADKASLARVTDYGQNLGLAFQIVDDILDVIGEKNKLGKTPGKDRQQNKLTYPALKGVRSAETEAVQLITRAKISLKSFGPKAKPLIDLADYIVSRQS
ncbi:MAG: polyprenyl synthetase family protein [Candidatus Brocadiia bacterium]